MNKFFCFFVFSFCFGAYAQLAVTVSTPRVTGQKAIVELNFKNGLTNEVESARAICILLDEQGKMVGQSTKWVIGQNKKVLEPNAEAKFNFVITTPQPLISSNLTAKIMFSKVNLYNGKMADVREVVQVMPATGGDKSKPQ
ncbi:MAG TPA: hypothetical protein VGY56_07005 [Verrucomicrobiae bacterium]|nr:hypothetical protein [Verrucomicrobiae bacterium]